MFRYEKDMIPIIKEFFAGRYSQSLSVEELNTGIGIADIVFSRKINKRKYYFNNFELLFHTLSLLTRKNKRISEIDFISRFSKKQINSIIEIYSSMELIEELSPGCFYIKNRLTPSVTKFYAIEAKLKDWKGGFYQAIRYKTFAQKTYLALSSDYIHRVDKDLFIKNNVGLLSVSKNKIKIIINPKEAKPGDKLAYYYLGEMFTKNIFLHQNQEEFIPQQWI
ncbi:MAG: hypothetical protein GWP10_20590 [Nitrospiraceae bacterium]|nr:hypothetical protein [Nitrospiraceae bacterium]